MIPIGFWQSKNELEERRMNFSILLLKTFAFSYNGVQIIPFNYNQRK